MRQAMSLDEEKYKKLLITADRKIYGNTVEVGPLTYARIFEAGHMAQEKKGLEVRDMVYKFIGIENWH